MITEFQNKNKPRRTQMPFLRSLATSFFVAVIFLMRVMSLQGQEAAPTPSPATPELQVPQIAPEFRPEPKALPELGRVGVEMDLQKPISVREALAMALENNKDIEVARHNVKIAEFDLIGARGAYDPRLSSSTYYERIVSPISSFLSGGSDGAVTQTDFTGNCPP